MKRLGGQALIDGIIMTGKKCSAIVRRKSSGRIDVETREKYIVEPSGIEKVFLVRGIINFINIIRDSVWNLKLLTSCEKDDESRGFIKFISKNKVLTLLFSIIFLIFVFLFYLN